MTDVIGSPHFLNYFKTDKTSAIIGAINSTFNGGAVFGALMGGFTMDSLGRKMTVGPPSSPSFTPQHFTESVANGS